MSVGSHAILSPSAASRWISCTPSARLEEQFPDTESLAAREGTLAHLLAELILKFRTGEVTKAQYKTELADIEAHELYEEAMYEHCDEYAAYVLEIFSEEQALDPEAILFLEQVVDLTEYIEDGYGTNDVSIISRQTLTVIDFKYGKGVVVSAIRNRQMMLYALGVLQRCGILFDVETVRMRIYQPRVDNFSYDELPVDHLYDWANTELKTAAALAFAGEGEYVAGTHCEFCRARAVCRANAEYNLEVARHEFRDPVLLEDDEIADILGRYALFTKWIESVKEHAYFQALKQNKKWPGFKLVAGRSIRVYIDPEAIANKLTSLGFAEEQVYTPKKLLGITALEKSIGKKVIAKDLHSLISKPSGKPVLVPVTDDRVELNSLAAAHNDFEGYFNGDENLDEYELLK